MDFVFKSFEDWLKELAISAVRGTLTDLFANIQAHGQSIAGNAMMKPSQYSPAVWGMVTSVAQTVVVPVAAIILTAVMLIEFISWGNEYNSFHNPSSVVSKLFQSIIKVMIGVLLVQHAHELTIGFFDLGAYLVTQSMGLVNTNITTNMPITVDAVCDQLREKELTYILSTGIFIWISSLGIILMNAIMNIIVWGRMIEIYLYCAMGSVPYATFTNREISAIGQNYIKNLLALAFQGFFIFLLVGIYGALSQGIAHTNDPRDAVMQLLMLSGVMVMTMFKTKALAKSIFAAS